MSGVVLAAGLSRRFGSAKQLADVGGRPLVRIAAECACASRLAQVIVVVGHEADAVTTALEGLPLEVVFNPAYADGQSTSVRAGLGRVAPTSVAAMFLPADQPGLTPVVVDTLIAAFERRPDAIVVPVCDRVQGAPVIFPRALFPALEGLSGDTGGRALFGEHAARLLQVPFDSRRPLADIDTPEDWDAWTGAVP